MIRLAMAAVLLAGAAPAAAVGYQTIYDFEDQTIGATSLALGMNPVNKASGGMIVTSAAAHSGSQVYQGTTLDFVVDDEVDYDWPAIGGWVSGTDAITLTAWNYNPNTQSEDLVGTATAGAGSRDVFIAVGSDMNPVQLTKWQFSSTSPFTLDDLTVGLVNTPGGIPEPAAWGLMVAGFAAVGAALRGRRRWSRAAA